MAKPKIQTSRKRVNRQKEELKAPDEVMTQLQRLSEHLSKHLKLYLGGLAAVMLLAVVIDYWLDSRNEAAVENSRAVKSATDAVHATVGEFAADEKPGSDLLSLVNPDQGPAEAVKTAYATDVERWNAALTQIAESKEVVGDDLSAVLSALEGRVQLELGKPGEASKALAAFTEAQDESSLLPLILENQGRAAEAAGDLSGASGHYAKLAAVSDAYYQMRGSMLLGDLYNPAMGKPEGKDAGKAGEYYDQALKALVPGEGQILPPAVRSLRAEIHRRKATL